MKIIIHLVLITSLAIACKNKASQPAPVTPAETTDSTAGSFLPIADLIKQDIRYVDSFAGGILNKTDINGKKDSSYIKPAEFHRIAHLFLLPELDSVSFSRHFTESSMMDESSQLLNFIYTAKDANHPLQKVIVYIKSTVANDKVIRIYMEKNIPGGQQKFTWKMKEYCYIVGITQPKTGPAVTSMNKVIWDPQRFEEE